MNCKFDSQFVTFNLTHNCNLRCHYCYSGQKSEKSMDTEKADQAIDFVLAEASKMQISQLDIIFFGGEPLLKQDLIYYICDRFAKLAPDLKVTFSLSTNGTLLNSFNIQKLIEKEIYISISIDGPPYIQDKQRLQKNGVGTSGILQEVIPELLRWNPCTNCRCVVTPFSAGSVARIIKWLAEQGFSYITTALDYSADWTRQSLYSLEHSLKELADWYCRRMQDGDSFYISCFDERISTRTKEPLQCSERCAIGLKQYSIAPSGRLYPCVQFVSDDKSDKYVIGDIWNGFDQVKRYSIFNSSEKEKEECQDCKIKDRCSSWCACANWSSTGNIGAVSPVVCEYERIIIPIADSIGDKLWNKRSSSFIHKFYSPVFPVLNFAEKLVINDLFKNK